MLYRKSALAVVASITFNLCAMDSDQSIDQDKEIPKNMIAGSEVISQLDIRRIALERKMPQATSVTTNNLFPGIHPEDEQWARCFNRDVSYEGSWLSYGSAIDQMTPRHIILTIPSAIPFVESNQVNDNHILDFIRSYEDLKQGYNVRNIVILFPHLSSPEDVEHYKRDLFTQTVSLSTYENFRFIVPSEEFCNALGFKPDQPLQRSLTVLCAKKIIAQRIQKDAQSFNDCSKSSAESLFNS